MNIIRLLAFSGRCPFRTRTLLLLLALIICVVTFQLSQLTQPLDDSLLYLEQIRSQSVGYTGGFSEGSPYQVYEDGIWHERPPPVMPPKEVFHPASPFAKVQVDFEEESPEDKEIREGRFKIIKKAFVHAWTGYRKFAFGADELRPLSKSKANPFNGWGATIVDALDTLLLLDLNSFYMEAREHIKNTDFSKSGRQVSLFETNIRYLGGLLSAYELSGGDELMLKKAVSLAEAMLPTFGSKTGLPVSYPILGSDMSDYGGSVVLAEAGTLSLEFTRLAQLTGDMKYYDPVQKITDFFESYKDEKYPGMFPNAFNIVSGASFSQHYSFGAMGDSFYEYLLKEHILIGGSNSQYKDMYIASVEALKKYFLRKGSIEDHTVLFIAQENGIYQNKMEHLTCFMPALLALGSKILNRPDDLRIAEGIAEGCAWAYHATITGVSWETWEFEKSEQVNVEHEDDYLGAQNEESNRKEVLKRNLYKRMPPQVNMGIRPEGIVDVDGRYLMRPETLESMFYLYRITGNKKWQEHAWRIFEAIDRNCRTDSAYASLESVDIFPASQVDNLESFFFAETLKYAALIFTTPDTLSLDEWVFNTEAHPLKRPTKKWEYAEIARKRGHSSDNHEHNL